MIDCHWVYAMYVMRGGAVVSRSSIPATFRKAAAARTQLQGCAHGVPTSGHRTLVSTRCATVRGHAGSLFCQPHHGYTAVAWPFVSGSTVTLCESVQVSPRRGASGGPHHARTAHLAKMHDKEYWSGLYASGRAPSEWFVDPDDLRPILDNAVAAALLTTSLTSTTTTTTSASGIPPVTEADKTDAAVFRLLDVGCGVSCVGAELIRDWATSTSEWGYEDGSTSTVQRQPPTVCVDAIDFAKTAVDAVTTEQADLIQSGMLRVQVADVLDPAGLPFERARFNLILDKGTLDAIVHGYSGEARDVAIITALSEVDRVARPGCALVHVSDEPPELRLPTLATTLTDWRLSWREVGTGGYTAFAYTGFKKVPE